MRRELILVAPPHGGTPFHHFAPVEAEIDASGGHAERSGKQCGFRAPDGFDHFVFSLAVPRRAGFPGERAGVRMGDIDQGRGHAELLLRQLADAGGNEGAQIASDQREAVGTGRDHEHGGIERIVRACSATVASRIAAHGVAYGRRDIHPRDARAECGLRRANRGQQQKGAGAQWHGPGCHVITPEAAGECARALMALGSHTETALT